MANPADSLLDLNQPLRIAAVPRPASQPVDNPADAYLEPLYVASNAQAAEINIDDYLSPAIPSYDFSAIENLDDERAELVRQWLGPEDRPGPRAPRTMEEFTTLKAKAESLGLTVDDVISDAEEQLSFGDKWASRLYRNGGPLTRGGAEGLKSIGTLVGNLTYRGLSFVPGLEQMASEADEANRYLEVSGAIADTLNREGDVAEFITPAGASLMGSAAQTLTEIYAVGGASKLATGGALTQKQAMLLTAGYFGVKRAEQELTVATDHNMTPTMRYAHAGVMGGTEALFTIMFGSLAGKYGVATAEEAVIVGRPAVANLMKRSGLAEAAAGMMFEGGEEAGIAASQMLWGTFAGTDTLDDGWGRVAKAAGAGAVTRGAIEIPGAVKRFRDTYKKTQDALPDTVKGAYEAHKAKQENRAPVIPENASEHFKAAVQAQFDFMQAQETDAKAAAGKAQSELFFMTEQGARRDAPADGEAQAEPEISEEGRTAIKNKVVETIETKRIAAELNEAHEAVSRAENAFTTELRSSLGLEALPEADHVSTIEAGRNAIAKGIPQRATEISAEVVSGKTVLDPDTQAGLVIQQGREIKSIMDLTSRRDALPATDTAARKALDVSIDLAKGRTDLITRALRSGGTETARTLAMRRYSPFDDYSPGTVRVTAETVKGGPLTDVESQKVTELAVRLATLEETLDTVKRPTAADAAQPKKLTDVEFLERELKRAEARKIAAAAQADPNTAEGQLLKEYVAKARAAKGGALTTDEANAIVAKVRKIHEQTADLNLLDRDLQQALYDDLDFARDNLTAELGVAIKGLEPKTIAGGLASINSFWKSWLTGFDGPPLFRQGITQFPSAVAKVPAWWRAFRDKKQSFLQERAILEHPLYSLALEHNVGVGVKGSTASLADELYINALTNRIRPLGATQRATSLMIRKLRMDSFAAYMNILGREGKVADGDIKAIAGFVNSSTGRGSLGEFANSSSALHQILVGPHFFMSRLQHGIGWYMWKAAVQGNRKAAKLMAREYAKQIIGFGIMTTLAEQFGRIAFGDDAVAFHRSPLDPNFGRLRVGNTMLDITGGVGRPWRYLNGLTEEARARYANRRPRKQAMRAAQGIVTSALGPAASAPIAANEVYAGRRDAADESRNYYVPWSLNDSAEALVREGADKGAAIAALNLLGAGGFTLEK